jgi:hypothetical protein
LHWVFNLVSFILSGDNFKKINEDYFDLSKKINQ